RHTSCYRDWSSDVCSSDLLKRRFHEVYWMEDEGCYAYGHDGHKKLITSIASNAGHCLWSGIADQDKAERTAKRLLQEDMWSGWRSEERRVGNEGRRCGGGE